MATTSSALTALYEDVVADLIPYFDNAVLLPNPQLIVNTYNISGAVGNTMKIPTHDAWSAGSTVSEGASIITDATSDFGSTGVSLTISKRGAGTYVNEEALEDGGMDTVRGAVLTQLSGSIAQATDQAGLNVMASGGEASLTDIANVDVSNDGISNAALLSTADVALVFSPQAGSYAIKREPTVKMDQDVDRDRYEMVATVRNGFARVRSAFVRAIVTSDAIDESDADIRAKLEMVSKSVASLRSVNAPTDAAGFYAAVVTPAQEYHLASQLNGVTVGSASIGDLSMVGNQALVTAIIGQAVGCRFVRSNNLPSGIASA